jgi:hypothetical protein
MEGEPVPECRFFNTKKGCFKGLGRREFSVFFFFFLEGAECRFRHVDELAENERLRNELNNVVVRAEKPKV